MFLDLHVAFVVDKAVKHESRIVAGAFDGHVVEGSVTIPEEGIEFESSARSSNSDRKACEPLRAYTFLDIGDGVDLQELVNLLEAARGGCAAAPD